jgi:stalled ribosome alternative rescue factor ArfA
MKKKRARRNPVAKALSSPLFRRRMVKSAKGKGAYRRRARTRQSESQG